MTRVSFLTVVATLLLVAFNAGGAVNAAISPDDADVNQDGVVNQTDIELVAVGDPRGDVNNDGTINVADLGLVESMFGEIVAGSATPTATRTGSAGHTLPPLPSGWPLTLQLGSADAPGGATALRQVAAFGLRYQYLAGGTNTGTGWSTWNPNGTFVSNYVQDSVNNDLVPVFTYYMIAQSRPGASQGEVEGIYNNLNNVATMTAYYNDLKLFLQRAGAFPNEMIVLHVEPDMWGFIQQRASGDDATTVSVQVAASGLSELVGLPNNARGLAQAIDRLRDQYAPNVVLGYHMSTWGTGNNPIYSNPSDSAIDALATRAATFFLSLHGGFDITFTDGSDRDAAFKEYQYGDGGASRMDSADYRRQVRWIGKYVEITQTRVIEWQIPLGNTKMRAQDNTWNHYQDNHVEWLLDDPARVNLREYVNAGVVAFLFGRGANGATCACDANDDGITNPVPINGNNIASISADDDGGFFKQRAAAYFAVGNIVLPIGADEQPPTPIGIDTVTPTRMPTGPPVQTVTATPTRTPMTPPIQTPTVAPTRTPTMPPAQVSTATPTRIPATPLASPTASVGGGGGCTKNCGTPRFFCDTGTWAFCDDYRDLYCSPLSNDMLRDCPFPDPSRVDVVSANVLSATDPRYKTFVDNEATRGGFFFNDQEHFHTEVLDGSFGLAITRHHQPVAIPSIGERHIHFEIDLKTSARRYVRVMLSPEIVKTGVDDRDPPEQFVPNKGLDLWIHDGSFVGSVYPDFPDGNAFFVQSPRYRGTDNIRDLVDIYVRRDHVRMVVNGVEYINKNIPDIGFDAGYLYLSQASYNPCKDGECAENLQAFHWDNVAFDGPVLRRNSLTPAGYQDVAFNAYSQALCKIKGIWLAAPMGQPQGYTWVTWVARVPGDVVVTPADVTCTNGVGGSRWGDTGRMPMDWEIVKP